MPEKAVISHRGEKYEIGRGKRFYGIWVVGAPYEAPIDRWPETRDGWQQAWTRFATMEEPGTIEPVTRVRKGLSLPFGRLRRGGAAAGGPDGRSGHAAVLLLGEGLLVLGVVLGLVGLFPAYEGGQSLISQWNQVVPHLSYVIGWALTAGFVALSVARPGGAARTGALFGLGLSAVTFGLFLADLGLAISSPATGSHHVSIGAGLVLSLIGWLACTTGSALAFAAMPGSPARPSRPVKPGRVHAGPLALLVLAGIGTAAAFAPSWDRYVLTFARLGMSQTITAGNAFDNPGVVIAGNVAVMAAIVMVAVLAALWRPARQGALLLAGAIVPLVTEVIAAIIQAGQQAEPAMFGITSAQATETGLRISSGLTGIFWVFLVFVISLLVSCAWLFTEPEHPLMPGISTSPWLPAGGDPATQHVAEPNESEDVDSAVTEVTDNANTDSEDGDTGAAESRPSADGDGEQSAYA